MRKKAVVMLMCGAMVLSLAACGSSSTTEKEEVAEEKRDESSENEAEEEIAEAEIEEEEVEEEEVKEEEVKESGSTELETSGLVACFEYLAQNVAIMTYDEAVEYMESTDFAFDTVKPSYDDLGTITSEDDEEGCHIWLAVYPDDSGEYTIYDVSYGNGHFEGSVSDNTHVTAPVYEIYNTYAEEPRTEVESLDDVISYIINEMPELIEEDSEVAAGETIDVALDATNETTSEGTIFTIETNLPDGMTLMLTLSGDNYTAQTKVTVTDGTAVSEAFSNKGASLSGNYELKITSGLATTQSGEVQSIIGADGENLSGEYVEEDSSGKKTITAIFDFSF